MGTSKKDVRGNKFVGSMNTDINPSMQTKGEDWRFALNAVKDSDQELGAGLSNENSNALHVLLPDGYQMRGYTTVEEENRFVVFLYNGSNSQIGIVDEDKRTYTEIVNDQNSNNQLNFRYDEWIVATTKYMTFGQCQHLMVYWSNNDQYKYADLDDDCCDYSDILLFSCECPSVVETSINEHGGRLPNGTYMYAIQLEDEDGNTTNFGKISDAIQVSGNDNKPGEISDKSVNITVRNLSKRFNKVNLAIISTVSGITSAKVLNNIHFGGGVFNYKHHGDTGREVDLPLVAITGRKNRYIEGKRLMQHDNRLILYQTKPPFNLNYQKKANNIDVEFVHYVVPSREAKNYSCLRNNENYLPLIRWNYCDGTSSAAFPLINKNVKPEYFNDAGIDCDDCKKKVWQVRDTSIVKLGQGMDTIDTYEFTGEVKLKSKPRIPYEDTVGDDLTVIPKSSDAPDMEKFMKEDVFPTYNEKDKKKRDCMCDSLGKIMFQVLQIKDLGQRMQILANPDLQAMICICKNGVA
jgi:hypothetical protein